MQPHNFDFYDDENSIDIVKEDFHVMLGLFNYFKKLDDIYNDKKISNTERDMLADKVYKKYDNTKYIGFIDLLYSEYIDVDLSQFTYMYDSCFNVLKLVFDIYMKNQND